MSKVTYALYAKAMRSDREIKAGEWVMCWNFDDEKTARALAAARKDVGTIRLVKHFYQDGQLINTEVMDYYH